MTTTFRTHTGEVISGQRLIDAFNRVADETIELAKAIRLEDAYASHVSEEVKDKNMTDDFALAEQIRSGEITSFTTWQNVNYAITGECVGFLPSPKK